MKTIEPELAAHLREEATTTCHCWKVTLRDGRVLGFTEHDEDLSFAGLIFHAASGFRPSEIDTQLGLAAMNGEIAGGFSSEALSEADLAKGLYDGARVELYLVNWQAPQAQHMLLHSRELGEVTRAGGTFRAELRSLSHRLGQPQGRVYGRRCDAVLGDTRCRADLSRFRARGTVRAIAADGRLTVDGLDGFADGAFRQGTLTFDSGETSGARFDLDDHSRREGDVTLTLWLPMPSPPMPGDAFTVTVGCDKSFATCRDTFANHLNFRGFPHMPGADFAYSYITSRTRHDGGALFS